MSDETDTDRKTDAMLWLMLGRYRTELKKRNAPDDPRLDKIEENIQKRMADRATNNNRTGE